MPSKVAQAIAENQYRENLQAAIVEILERLERIEKQIAPQAKTEKTPQVEPEKETMSRGKG